MYSGLWEFYPPLNQHYGKNIRFGEFFKVNDPKTEKPSLRNFVDTPQKGDLPGGGVTGISEMLEKGSLFCVCGVATKIISGIFAKKMNLDADEVYQDFKNHIIDGHPNRSHRCLGIGRGPSKRMWLYLRRGLNFIFFRLKRCSQNA